MGMPHVMLPNLRLILFFVRPVVESFKKVLMGRLTMGNIVVYCTTIIPNILNKVGDCMKLRVVKGWST